jgi:sulfatase maturation enzyme AslB (radical SAM superfamily)
MWCPRVKHFARINHDGTVSRCGHMTNAPKFQDYTELESSAWQKNFEQQWANGIWPPECERCQQSEITGADSVRTYELKKFQSNQGNYFTLGGVLDNVCNSACQFCSSHLSTKIGSIESKKFIKINNYSKLSVFPWEQITHLDINGGEPSASPNYKKLLQNPPPNLKSVRINTNASKYIKSLETLISKNIQVTITISLDGTESVYEYVRWPGKWQKLQDVLNQYKKITPDINFWTTVNALNIGDFDNIVEYAKSVEIDHAWAFLNYPHQLDAKYKNSLTLAAKEKIQNAAVSEYVASLTDNQSDIDDFIKYQDSIRNISIKDFL